MTTEVPTSSLRIVLKRGLEISGSVLDDEGKPVGVSCLCPELVDTRIFSSTRNAPAAHMHATTMAIRSNTRLRTDGSVMR